MFLPAEIIQLFDHFAPAFTKPTYRKALLLVTGAILAKGQRTVTAALRVMGREQESDWSKYHHVLNRAQWSGLQVSEILLKLLVKTFISRRAPITITVDETLERRWGPQIRKRGHWRDSLASGRNMNVSASGLRWLVFALVIAVPWSSYYWSLPFLSILLTTPKVSEKLGKRHKKVSQRTAQVICWLRRTLPGRPIHLVGDGAYSVIRLGLRAQKCGIVLIAPLRLDARLFDLPPSRLTASGKKRRGRRPGVGQRLPNLSAVALVPSTVWHRSKIAWYGGKTEVVDWATGTALWYSSGIPPLAIRWVLVRDPAGERPLRAFFTTDQHQSAPAIIADFVKRWSLEVTFEESRAVLGVETQRQWSDKAIERTTPALLGLYSLVVLMAHVLFGNDELPLPKAAWYQKDHATFHDVLFIVRCRLWYHSFFRTSVISPDLHLFPPGSGDSASNIETNAWKRLISAACY